MPMTKDQRDRVARMYATALSNRSHAEAGAYIAVVSVLCGPSEVALVEVRGQEILKEWGVR